MSRYVPTQPGLFEPTAAQADPNPCVSKYGFGPEGARCRTCAKLFVRQRARRYYKCELRGETGGPGTDHRVRWRACAQYVRGEPGTA